MSPPSSPPLGLSALKKRSRKTSNSIPSKIEQQSNVFTNEQPNKIRKVSLHTEQPANDDTVQSQMEEEQQEQKATTEKIEVESSSEEEFEQAEHQPSVVIHKSNEDQSNETKAKRSVTERRKIQREIHKSHLLMLLCMGLQRSAWCDQADMKVIVRSLLLIAQY